MKLKRTLKNRIAKGEPVSGVLLRIPSEEIVEIAASCGVDFILIDCEHGPNDTIALRQHVSAAAIFGVETIVRVGSADQSDILRALDLGASGIVYPHIDDQHTAAQVVQWSRYRPLGDRGFALYSRAAGYGTISAEEHRARTESSVLVFAMLESPAAAAAADDILRTPGLDGYMIGTSDLAASTGPTDPPTQESVATINLAGRSRGSVRLDIVNSREAADDARADGANVIVYNTTALLAELFLSLSTPTDPPAGDRKE